MCGRVSYQVQRAYGDLQAGCVTIKQKRRLLYRFPLVGEALRDLHLLLPPEYLQPAGHLVQDQ